MDKNNNLKDRIFEYIAKKLETLFKTDIRYIISNGFWLGINQTISTGTAFLLSIAFANLIMPETLGTYKYILSITSILLIPTLSGMDSAITQSVAKGFDGSMHLGFTTKTKWGGISFLLSLAVSIYYYISGNQTLSLAFLIISTFLPFIESFDLYGAFLNGKKLFKEFTIFNVIKKIFSSIALLTSLFLTDNVLILISVYFLSTLFINIIFYLFTKNRFVENNKTDEQSVPFGKHISLTHIFNILVGELDKILIFQYLGGINLAIYTLAGAPIEQIKAVLKNINVLAMPKITNQSEDLIKKTIFHKMIILSFIAIATSIFYFFAAPFLYKIFFPQYLDSIIYSQILVISVVGIVISSFFYTILEAKKNIDGIYKYNIVGGILNIIILFPLIHSFGILGAIIAKILGRFVFVVIGYVLVKNIKTE